MILLTLVVVKKFIAEEEFKEIWREKQMQIMEIPLIRIAQEEARKEARKEAEREAEKKWQIVVAEKDTALAEKDAQIARLLAQLNGNK